MQKLCLRTISSQHWLARFVIGVCCKESPRSAMRFLPLEIKHGRQGNQRDYDLLPKTSYILCQL
jgi:hypothetical protein